MSFLFPVFVFGSLAAAGPLIIHLINRDRVRTIEFSDTRFVERSRITRTKKLELHDLLLLTLRVVALLLLVVVFARPFMDRPLINLAMTVIVIDRSLSMSVPEKMERARGLAEEAILESPADHLVAVIAFDDQSIVLQEGTSNRGAAVAALDRLSATPGATNFAAGVLAANEIMGSRSGRIVFVTDLQQAGWDSERSAEIPSRVDLDVRVVDEIETNVAVTSVFSLEEHVSASVLNIDDTSRDVTMRFAVDGSTVETRVVRLVPGMNEVIFQTVAPSVGTAVVEVDDPAGFAFDNRRYHLLETPSQRHVMVVVNRSSDRRSTLFFERALEIESRSEGFNVQRRAAGALPTLSDRDWETVSTVILLGTDGLVRQSRERLAEFVASGGSIFVASGPDVEPAFVADVLGKVRAEAVDDAFVIESRRWVITETRHPVFQAFVDVTTMFEQVWFRRARSLDEVNANVLARFDDGSVALAEYEIGLGKAIVFGSDLNGQWNDFPRRSNFLPFVHETVAYLEEQDREEPELFVADVSDEASRVLGPVTLQDSGRRVVVNFDPRESSPLSMTRAQFVDRIKEVKTERVPQPPFALGEEFVRHEKEQAYWWYAALLMLAVLLGEAWLAHRMA